MDKAGNGLKRGALFCWGSTTNGELGLGGIEEDFILKPRRLTNFAGESRIKDIVCGKYHTVVLLQNGTLYSCGFNDQGQLGHSKSRRRFELVASLELHVIRSVSCGESHTLAVNEAGQVFAWGSNVHGQLGFDIDDGQVQCPRVIRSLALHRVVQVACGFDHSLALTENGNLYSWGLNNCGQLGLGTASSSKKVPTRISSLSGVPLAQIAAGGYHSFGLTKSGALFGWGKNTFGQLGLNHTEDSYYPNLLKSLRSQKIKYVCCGEHHTAVLTQDGGVFTFGAGMYGQLGNNTKGNEILPRKVLELMGTIVSQIACGRCHTMAYLPHRGKVYAFGLAGSGQLGTGNSSNRFSPVMVAGPWVAPVFGVDGVPKIDHLLDQSMDVDLDSQDDDEDVEFVVYKIACGGDQSFALSSPISTFTQPRDFRVMPKESQILTLDNPSMQQVKALEQDKQVDQDLMSYLESTLSSNASLNGSFLIPNDAHYCCNSKNPGVDVSAAYHCFQSIEECRNSTIHVLVGHCLGKELLPSLPASPPDIEAMRLYLFLPFCHLFHNAEEHLIPLTYQFGKSILHLPPQASKVIDYWWAQLEVPHFRNLVRIYKKGVTFILNTYGEDQNKTIHDEHMHIFLDMLEKLHKVNLENNEVIPYQEFYISEVTDKLDIRRDYAEWLHSSRTQRYEKMFFCDYPFVFDAQAKTLILQTDSIIQMQEAMNIALQQIINSFLEFSLPTNQPFLLLFVDRNNLLSDTLTQLSTQSSADMKKPLKVFFAGEDVVDAGGPRKEFFLLLFREVLDPKYGMFTHYPETRCIWFSAQTFEEADMFRLIGNVCGLAIYNSIIIDLPFPLVLYKKLLNEKVKLEDLKGLSTTVAKGLNDLLKYEGDDVEDIFSLYFEITQEVYGEMVNYELKAGGKDIMVTRDNRHEYVELYVDYLLNKSVEASFSAFAEGFYKVCGSRVLRLFHAQELMALVVGNEDYDWQELENQTEYKNQYNKDHRIIRMFWKIFHSLPLSKKKKFLLFLTGSDRIPILGMKSVKIVIQPMGVTDNHLPVAHTCFNILDLPTYSSEDIMRQKLLQAIENTQGFGLA